MDSEKKDEQVVVPPVAASPFVSRQRKVSKPTIVTVVFMLLVSISTGFLGGWLGSESHSANLNNPSTAARQQIISSESQLISEIAKNVGPSVVSVNVVSEAITNSFFGFGGGSTEQQSAGTGVIISADVIVTNRHVVPKGITKVSVTLSDGTELTDVEVLGRTNENDSLDVAFLKVKDKKGKDLKPAALGDSAKMEVGAKVVAIGNALGQFQNTVTAGIVSGYGRSVTAGDASGGSSETLQNLFQTDAAINEGNSGGPLVNISGEVIGINTAVAGQGAENVGFAIPINDISGLIKGVLATGKLERPYLGVRYVSLTDDYAFEFNLPVKRGAYVVPKGRNAASSILPGSPAEKTGLKEKDIIVKINDTLLDEKNSLTSTLGKLPVGDTAKLTVLRDGKEQVIEVKLEAVPTD